MVLCVIARMPFESGKSPHKSTGNDNTPVAHTSRELFTFFVAGIGAATALGGEQCRPRAGWVTAFDFACRALGAATDRAASLLLPPPLVVGLCTHTALETDGILPASPDRSGAELS